MIGAVTHDFYTASATDIGMGPTSPLSPSQPRSEIPRLALESSSAGTSAYLRHAPPPPPAGPSPRSRRRTRSVLISLHPYFPPHGNTTDQVVPDLDPNLIVLRHGHSPSPPPWPFRRQPMPQHHAHTPAPAPPSPPAAPPDAAALLASLYRALYQAWGKGGSEPRTKAARGSGHGTCLWCGVMMAASLQGVAAPPRKAC